MIRGRWTDISVDWVDYQEARVEILSVENNRLRTEIDFLRRLLQDLAHDREIKIEDDGQDVSRLLVPTLPLPPAPRSEMIQ